MLEVENPDYGRNKRQRKSRIEFYRRNGAVMLKNVRYILPPLGGKTSTEMNLMILPMYSQPTMKKNAVGNLILRIYNEVYGRSEDDQIVRSTCQGIPDTIHLT